MKTFNKAELLAIYPNMSVWETGGGCTALGMPLDDGGHILITDDGSVPDDGALHVCAGRYDKHGEWDELRAPYGGMDVPVRLLEAWIDRQVSEAVQSLGNREAFKLARATLRKAVKEYGFIRFPDRPHYVGRIGKFEGEHWSIVHYYDAMLNGVGDAPFMAPGTVEGTPFEVSDVERQAFGFEPDTDFVVLWHSQSGFETLTELSAGEYDRTRERYDNAAQSVVTYTAPSAWASYLINGDDSGISAEDKAAADAWIESVGLGGAVSCEDAGFMWRHDAYAFMPLGADCQHYKFYTEEDV